MREEEPLAGCSGEGHNVGRNEYEEGVLEGWSKG